MRKKFFYEKGWFWILLAATGVFIVIILPIISEVYYEIFSKFKVNPEMINLNRIEILKIFVSLVGPILTFFVFQNSLNIQDEARRDRKEDREKLNREKKDAIKRRNLENANVEFYSLLKLFNKEQINQETRDSIDFLYSAAIYSKYGRAFINSYRLDDSMNGDVDIPLLNGETKTISRYLKDSETKLQELDTNQKSIFALSKQFDDVYNMTSSYFKIFHRVLKNINNRLYEKEIDEKEYKNFIGILRTQLSSEELVVILVNSLYIKRGLGLGIQLIGTNLFGDEKDLRIEQHFIIPKPVITLNDLLIFINDKEGNNTKKRRKYDELLKNIDDITKFESIDNFKSFIK